MPESPVFSLEEQYQALEQQLILFPLDRLNLYRLVRFFQQPSASLRAFRSYFIEAAEWFDLLMNPPALKFQSPEFYQKLFQVVTAGTQIIEPGPIQTLYHGLIRTWKRYAAESQFYLGEYSIGLGLLQGVENALPPAGNLPGKGDSGYQRFHFWRDQIKTRKVELDGEAWEILEEIDADWKAVTRLSRDQLWTLLIARDLGLDQAFQERSSVPAGILQPLLVTTELLGDQTGADAVIFHNKTSTIDDLAYQQSRDAVEAARQIFPKRGQQAKNHLKVSYSFPDAASVYTGDSMGFAMGLVTVANLSRILESFQEYRLPQNMAVTGALDQYGELRPISPESLRIKMEALFYSPFEVVGLPAENYGDAQTLYSRFLEKYPHRELKIIPVHSLRDAVHRSRLVIKKAVPFSQQLKIVSRNWAAIAALTVLTVLGLIFLPTWDRNPAGLEMQINGLTVSNKNHRVLWTYPVDVRIWPNQRNLLKILGRWEKRSLIADLDGDGKNEVITTLMTQKEAGWTGKIICFDSDGRLKWDFEDFPRLMFGNIWYKPFYRVHKFLSFPPDPDDDADLFVVADHDPWFPTLLLKFSNDGKLVDTYVHSGHFHNVAFLESGDPFGEKLLFYGTNNDYNNGVLGILNPDHLDGHSPQDQFEYTPQGVEIANHELYLRFPQLTDIFPYRARSTVVSVNKKNRAEYRVDLLIGTWGQVIYTLDTNFFYRDVDFADGLLTSYRTEFNRDIFEDYTLDELKYRLSEIEYWENGKWVVHRGILDSLTYFRP